MQCPKYIILYFEIHDIKHQFEIFVYCLFIRRVDCQNTKHERKCKEKETNLPRMFWIANI